MEYFNDFYHMFSLFVYLFQAHPSYEYKIFIVRFPTRFISMFDLDTRFFVSPPLTLHRHLSPRTGLGLGCDLKSLAHVFVSSLFYTLPPQHYAPLILNISVLSEVCLKIHLYMYISLNAYLCVLFSLHVVVVAVVVVRSFSLSIFVSCW